MCIVSYNSRQIRFTSGVSINPVQWNKATQRPNLNKCQTRQDMKQAATVNKQLTQIDLAFQDFCIKFADELATISQVRNIVNIEKMARPKKAETATALLTQALMKSGVKENTINTKTAAIKKFAQYLTAKGMANSYLSFTDNIIIQFHTWLCETMSANTANNTASQIASLIKAIYTDEQYIHLGIPAPKQYKAAKDKRTKEDKKHCEILEDEIQAIKNYTGTAAEEKAAKAFYIQCREGVRFSDLQAAIEAGQQGEGVRSIDTNKEGIQAQLVFTAEDAAICNSIGTFSMTYGNFYNYLRRVAKALNLNRQITYTDADGKKQTEPLYDVITSHCARVTKATQLLRQGISKDIIIKMLAWTDTAMLDRIYGQLTTEDKEKQVAEALAATPKQEQATVPFGSNVRDHSNDYKEGRILLHP